MQGRAGRAAACSPGLMGGRKLSPQASSDCGAGMKDTGRVANVGWTGILICPTGFIGLSQAGPPRKGQDQEMADWYQSWREKGTQVRELGWQTCRRVNLAPEIREALVLHSMVDRRRILESLSSGFKSCLSISSIHSPCSSHLLLCNTPPQNFVA